MRKLVSGLFIALDGVAEAPNLWQFEFDAEMAASMDEQLMGVDGILLGRVTYQEWVDYWPGLDKLPEDHKPFAVFINNTPKYVVSTTLDKVAWGDYDNISLISGAVVDEIAKLKQSGDGKILVTGSPSLVNSLLQADLLDELILLVHPVVAGSGKHLFKDAQAMKRLKLVSGTTTSSGVAILTYQPLPAE